MSKSTHFFGQPVYGQLIKLLDKDKIIQFSRNWGGERYVKCFDGFTHLITMLYAVIMRFDSLREIETSMIAEVRKLHHVGIRKVPKRSTLSDANARRSEKFFEDVYRDLYASNKDTLTSDSRRNGSEEWLKRSPLPAHLLLAHLSFTVTIVAPKPYCWNEASWWRQFL